MVALSAGRAVVAAASVSEQQADPVDFAHLRRRHLTDRHAPGGHPFDVAEIIEMDERLSNGVALDAEPLRQSLFDELVPGREDPEDYVLVECGDDLRDNAGQDRLQAGCAFAGRNALAQLRLIASRTAFSDRACKHFEPNVTEWPMRWWTIDGGCRPRCGSVWSLP